MNQSAQVYAAGRADLTFKSPVMIARLVKQLLDWLASEMHKLIIRHDLRWLRAILASAWRSDDGTPLEAGFVPFLLLPQRHRGCGGVPVGYFDLW